MQGVTNALLNMILVSIPEELFLTVMTLIFLKRFDMLDIRMWRYNLKWIMIPIVLMGLNINIMRYILHYPKVIVSLSSLIIFSISITYVIRKNSFDFNKRTYGKIFIAIFLSFSVFSLLEGVTCPIILYLMNKSIEFFNNNILWNFVLSLPSRIFGFILIGLLVVRHNNVINIKIFETISKNKFMLYSIVLFAVISNIITVYILKLIGIDRVLEGRVSLIEQACIIMGSLIIPAIILSWMLLLINYLLVKERQIQQTYENLVMQDDVMLDVED